MAVANQYAKALVTGLRESPGVKQVVAAGSYRRAKETIGDLDILVIAASGSPVMDRFVSYPEVEEILAHGATKASVRLACRLQVDVRVVPDDSCGAALQYFTSSKAHNVALRQLAQQQGLKIKEYGVFRGDRAVAGATKESVYSAVRLPWIPLELWENRGEIDRARAGRLPVLVEVADLCRLDLVIGAVHSHFRLTREKQIERILRAMDHPYFTILAHPSGRLIDERAPYDMDMARVIHHARERGCFLEVNAHPIRLDLTDTDCQMAKEEGVVLSINSDAHSGLDLGNLRYGVGQACRGWLEKKDVLNTRSLQALRPLLKRTMVKT